jgi:hypothetical protein
MSTSWKSLAAGFAAGVVSTGVYALGAHLTGAALWFASLAYIFYVRQESK